MKKKIKRFIAVTTAFSMIFTQGIFPESKKAQAKDITLPTPVMKYDFRNSNLSESSGRNLANAVLENGATAGADGITMRNQYVTLPSDIFSSLDDSAISGITVKVRFKKSQSTFEGVEWSERLFNFASGEKGTGENAPNGVDALGTKLTSFFLSYNGNVGTSQHPYGLDSGCWLDGAYTAPLDTWTTEVVTYDINENKVVLYANGKEQANAIKDKETEAYLSVDDIKSLTKNNIGNSKDFWSMWGFMTVSDIEVYSQALTQEQVEDISTDAVDLAEADSLPSGVLKSASEADTYIVVSNSEAYDSDTKNIDLSKIFAGITLKSNGKEVKTVPYGDITLTNADATYEIGDKKQVSFKYGNHTLTKNIKLVKINKCSEIKAYTSDNTEWSNAKPVSTIAKYGSIDIFIKTKPTEINSTTTDDIVVSVDSAYKVVRGETEVEAGNVLKTKYTIVPQKATEGTEGTNITFTCGEHNVVVKYKATERTFEDSLVAEYKFSNNTLTDSKRKDDKYKAVVNNAYVQDEAVYLQDNTFEKNNNSYVDLSMEDIASELKRVTEISGVNDAGFTVSFDFKPESSADIGNQNTVITFKTTNNDGTPWEFMAITSDGSVQSNKICGKANPWWFGGDSSKDSMEPVAKEWSNMTVTIKNNTCYVYINGVLVNEFKRSLTLNSATDKEKEIYNLQDLKSDNGFFHYFIMNSAYGNAEGGFDSFKVFRIGQTDVVGKIEDNWMGHQFNGAVDNVRFYSSACKEADAKNIYNNSRAKVSESSDTVERLEMEEVSGMPDTVVKNEQLYTIRESATDTSGVIVNENDTYTIDISKIFSALRPYVAGSKKLAKVAFSDAELSVSEGNIAGNKISGISVNKEVTLTAKYRNVTKNVKLKVLKSVKCSELAASIVNPKDNYNAFEDSFDITVTSKYEVGKDQKEEISVAEDNEKYDIEKISSTENEDGSVTNVYRVSPVKEVKNGEIKITCYPKQATVQYNACIVYKTVSEEEQKNNSAKRITSDVSVHDPSIIASKDSNGNEEYMVFGSHMGVAKSSDLENWNTTSISDENPDNAYYGKRDANGKVTKVSYENAFESGAYGKKEIATKSGKVTVDFSSFNAGAWNTAKNNYTIKGNMWAPDIIYNEAMGKYCLYTSLNGDKWNSVIVLLTSDNIEGPYVYEAPILYSGFTEDKDSAVSYKKTDLHIALNNGAAMDSLPARYAGLVNAGTHGEYWPHAIDPGVFYADDGTLWMNYGSWSGGIYMIKLDKNTGLRDYTQTYEYKVSGQEVSGFSDSGTKADKNVTSDPYFGKKIAGGHYVSGEGSYIEKIENYYFLFMSYGFYSPDGGYTMRIFRSENPDGPYVDEAGNSAIYTSPIHNYNGSSDAANIGEKIMGNYKWNSMSVAEIAQGHNSAFVDKNGRAFVIYHTKFYSEDHLDASHAMRVHELYLNKNGWLVASPYRYCTSDEGLSQTGYAKDEVVGTYDLIVHKYKIDFANEEYVSPVTVKLCDNGTVKGDATGTWSMQNGSPYVDITIDGKKYSGVFCKQTIDGTNVKTMCFTAAASNGVNVWGSMQTAGNIVISNAASKIDVVQSTLGKDITLPLETGVDGVNVTWSSDNEAVISNTGKVNTPAKDTVVTLTMTMTYKNYKFVKEYHVTAYSAQENWGKEKKIASYFVGEKKDVSTGTVEVSSIANPFRYGFDLSKGVKIKFNAQNKSENINVLSAILAFMAPNGGRMYFSSGSYWGYNDNKQENKKYFDANLKDYQLVKNYIGTKDSVVEMYITRDGIQLYVDGKLAYDNTIFNTDGAAKTVEDFSEVLNWLSSDADTVRFGSGSWWNIKADTVISELEFFVLGDETPSTEPSETPSTEPSVLPSQTPSASPTSKPPYSGSIISGGSGNSSSSIPNTSTAPVVSSAPNISAAPVVSSAPSTAPSTAPVVSNAPAASSTPDSDIKTTIQKPSDVAIEVGEKKTETKVDESTGETIIVITTKVSASKVVTEEIIVSKDGSKLQKLSTVTEANDGKLHSEIEVTTGKEDGKLVISAEADTAGKIVSAKAAIHTGSAENTVLSVSKKSIAKVSIPQSFITQAEKHSMVANVDIRIEKPTVETFNDTKANKKISKQQIEVVIPYSPSVNVGKVVITKESVSVIQKAAKDTTIVIQKIKESLKKTAGKLKGAEKSDDLIVESYSVTLKKSQIALLAKNSDEINIGITNTKLSQLEDGALKNLISSVQAANKAGKSEAYVLSIADNDNLKAGFEVETPIFEDVKAGQKVYIYRYNSKSDKLEEVPYSAKTMSSYVTLKLHVYSGKDYIVSTEKLKKGNVTSLLSQVKVNIGKKSIKKGKKTNVSVKLPKDMVAVSKLTASVPFAKEGVTVAYKSLNKKILTVSSKGVVKAKKKGKGDIQVTISQKDGTKKTKKLSVTVKK